MPALLWLSCLVAGCGGGAEHVACHQARGKVLIGEEPAPGIDVLLLNQANPGNIDAPQPYATTGPDGTFSLSTFEPGDGAPAGDYLVILKWPEGPPGPGIPADRLGNAFTDPAKTPYRATIAARDNQLEPFRIDPAAVKKGKPAK